ncbi:permease [Paenibacillus kribbensis]|uniref:permease n=1 Tax=Paenibacillus kribbensis TaxID=172713 RepID=UPI002DBE94D7|nr:permease [Paenibacillus kribbensis]MEC0236510.1 permease [Paenibacillus kribbensis]
MKNSTLLKMLPFMIPFVFLIPVLVTLSPRWLRSLDMSQMQSLKTVFMGIFLEAMPFLLIGVLVSSLLQCLVPEAWIRKMAPAHPVPGVLLASLLGLLFPICECGMIPVVRQLMLKGMPAYMGITFILSGPIINPVVLAATMMAFPSHPEVTAVRIGLAFAVSAMIGLIVYTFVRVHPLKRSLLSFNQRKQSGQTHRHHRTMRGFFVHAGDEFLDMSKYLIIGALLTACIQTFIPRDEMLSLSGGTIGSYVFMMGFAYVLSLCSTSDAFVATAFSHTFTLGPLAAFLVLGPMLDFKGTLMLLSTFRTKFVTILCLLIISLVLVGSIAAEWLLGK